MVVGSFSMAISIIGSLLIYIFSANYQYYFDRNQELYHGVSDLIINLMPLGIVLFAICFARHTRLLSKISGRSSV